MDARLTCLKLTPYPYQHPCHPPCSESQMALDLRSGMLRPATLHHAITKGTLSAPSSLVLKRAVAQASEVLTLGEGGEVGWGCEPGVCSLPFGLPTLCGSSTPALNRSCSMGSPQRPAASVCLADTTSSSLIIEAGSRASHLQTAAA